MALSWQNKKYLQERCILVDVKHAQKMAFDPWALPSSPWSWQNKKFMQERCTLVDVKDAQNMAFDPEAFNLSLSTSKTFVFDMELRNED